MMKKILYTLSLLLLSQIGFGFNRVDTIPIMTIKVQGGAPVASGSGGISKLGTSDYGLTLKDDSTYNADTASSNGLVSKNMLRNAIPTDSSFRIITADSLGKGSTIWKPYKPSGLLLRNTSTAYGNQATPPIMFQGYQAGNPYYFRIWVNAASSPTLTIQYSTDSINWSGTVTIDKFGNMIGGGYNASGDILFSSIIKGDFIRINGRLGNVLLGSNANIANPLASLQLVDSTKGILGSRVTTRNADSIMNVPTGTIVPGSGYSNTSTNGTLVSLTGGSGTGAKASVRVTGGKITNVTYFSGLYYKVGDVLTSSELGAGTGFTWTITKISGDDAKGLQMTDTTGNRPIYFNGKYWVGGGGLKTVRVADSYTITNEDVIFVNNAEGTATLTLPSAAYANRPIWIRNLSSANTVTISGMASGEPTTIPISGGIQVTSDGTNFYAIGKY